VVKFSFIYGIKKPNSFSNNFKESLQVIHF